MNIVSGDNIGPQFFEISSIENERMPWNGKFSPKEIDRPGGQLMAALVECAKDRKISLKNLAKELNVDYGYINQLRNGNRPVNKIGDKFSSDCAKFLNVPRMTVLLLSGVITPSDVFEKEGMLAAEIPQAMGFICNDMVWGHLVTNEMRSANELTHFTLIKLYEGATGKVLLNKLLTAESLQGELDKLNSIQENRTKLLVEHAKKKHRSRLKKSKKID